MCPRRSGPCSAAGRGRAEGAGGRGTGYWGDNGMDDIRVKPDDGVETDPRCGRAWCPYCADSLEYVWDEVLRIVRCPGCGVSTRDFHVKSANGFWNEALKQRFDDGVKRSRRIWLKGERKMVSQTVLRLPIAPWE